ncbi:hypothetical protein FS837_005896 [Tulasnella sp. UAMH 9824]|nr:hypothetical protein FS837_005896 [Tulasnella sp. UAMH 9824]
MRNTPFLRELHSRAAILSNLPLSDRPARALNPVLKRTIRSSSLGPKSPIRGGTYARRIKVLKAIGTLGMGYGAYNTLGVWLKEEWDLRVADRAKQKERTRAGYSERAPGTIATLFDSAAAFSADLDIKISTISLSFADTLETVGDFPRAYSVYKSTFAELTDNLPSSSETNDSHEVEKRILAIVTALKMAELGELILHLRALGKAPTDPDSGPADEAEVREKFDWALTEALRLRTAAVKPPEKGEEKEIETISPLRWAQEVDLATIMGRVADYYSRKGMVE